MRHLFIPFLCFIGFFVLFWNVKQWNVPTTKKIGLVSACAGASAVASGVAIWIFITVFN
jgi:hypothetical protein